MRSSHLRFLALTQAAALASVAFCASGEEVLFNILKDQSYAAIVPVKVAPVPEGARYIRFMMQVPEGTELALYAEEGRGDGELWVIETRLMVLTEQKTEYFVPFTEEIGRPRRVIDTADADVMVGPLRAIGTVPHRDQPEGDGRLDPASVDKFVFFFWGINGVDMLGIGSYRVEDMQFVPESPFEESLDRLDRLEVDVDASKPLGELNPIWRDLFLSNDITARLPQRAVRIPVFGIAHAFPQDGPNGQFNWDEADAMVEEAKRRGEFVIQIVGRDTPPWLWDPDKPESKERAWSGWRSGNLMPPVDMKAYEELQYRMARHFNVEKGYGVKYFEFWTEPDGWSWYRGPLADYVKMYEAFARGVKRADPSAKVGCPGLANYNIHWLRLILEYCDSHDVPLDFVSFHHYGSHARAFGDHIAHFRAMIAKQFPRFKDAEILWSEWNNQIVPYEEAIAFKSTAAHAAFAADCIRHMADQHVDMATFSFVPGDPELWKGMGLFLPDQKTPKPVYNTLRLFTAMEGTQAERVQAQVNVDECLGLGAFAARAKEHIAVAVWWNLEVPDPPGLEREGTLTMHGIRFTGQAVLERYLIDEAHSNYKAGLQHQNLEKIEEESVMVIDGSVEIPLQIGVSTVQLFKISPD